MRHDGNITWATPYHDGAIVGWEQNATTDDLYSSVLSYTISDYKDSGISGDLIVYKIHSEKLVDGQAIHSRVKVGTTHYILIGTRINQTRGRYILLTQTGDEIYAYRITDGSIKKATFSGNVESIDIPS